MSCGLHGQVRRQHAGSLQNRFCLRRTYVQKSVDARTNGKHLLRYGDECGFARTHLIVEQLLDASR